jgi:uncharacterized protein (TIGR00290 family)
MTDVVLAWSGGKDSALALAALNADPRYRVQGLITTVTSEYDRISMHGVRRAVLDAQVRALRLPLIPASIPPNAGNSVYEVSFAGALRAAQERWPGLAHIAFGDLFLTEVRQYRERLLDSLNWTGVFPIWGMETAGVAKGFVEAGHRAILTCVDTAQLGPDFVGREFDLEFLADLPSAVDPCGERGEFHTCVYAGPLFERPLHLVRGERVRRDDRFEYCDLQLATVAA